MAQSDIYLRSERATAVGELDVATGRDADADVSVNPNSAAVTLGGGDGQYSDGDLLFRDRDDDVRVHVTGGGGSRQEPANNRVYVDGSTGEVRLGAASTDDAADVRVNPNSAAVTLGGGAGDYSDGDLVFRDRDDDARIHLTGGGGSRQEPSNNRVFVDGSTGEFRLGAASTAGDDVDVELVPQFATLNLGGGAGENSDGDVVMMGREGVDRVHVDAGGNGPTSGAPRVYVSGGEMTPQDARDATRDHPVTIRGAAGSITLGGDGTPGRLGLNQGGAYETVDLDGEAASLSLGGAPQRSSGTAGSVTLYNGHEVGTVGLDAASGTVEVGSQGYRGTDRGAQSGAVVVVHESGETTAELRGDEGGVVAGGAGKEGSLMLKNADGEPVGLLEADGDELVLTDGAGTPVLRIGQGGSVSFPQGGP